ncbi:unnamed protein product [Rotaria magnacalcarata]|uniref:NAD(P)(+)--arginine ADP-ribosyltransferase n=2 Tax=Rotaria magnacalcarata TaxID=392030 RepID=A0A816UYT1_9BILA|nr:unnamed protein product [Rotaria magnacalcarata]
MLDNCCIDFEHSLQILNTDHSQKRPTKQVVRNREDKHLREERFVDLPVDSARPFGGQYGWVSPFIIEIRRALGLSENQLPPNNPELIPMLVEKAAQGIIAEGKSMGKEQEANKIAKILTAQKNSKVEDVWKCCVYLYTLESFLYKILNKTMRLIGSKEDEQNWQSKIHTLGPFGLLLWDDPINERVVRNETLYRGVKLEPEQIVTYQNMAAEKKYGSFQVFSSCSHAAFIADVNQMSEYPKEEEQLITPGVCFSVQRVEFDHKTNKHLIYLKLRQRLSGKHTSEISTFHHINRPKDKFDDYHVGNDAYVLYDNLDYDRDADTMGHVYGNLLDEHPNYRPPDIDYYDIDNPYYDSRFINFPYDRDGNEI